MSEAESDLLISEELREEALASRSAKAPTAAWQDPTAPWRVGLGRVNEELRGLQEWLLDVMATPEALQVRLPAAQRQLKIQAVLAALSHEARAAQQLALANGLEPVLDALVAPRQVRRATDSGSATPTYWLEPDESGEPAAYSAWPSGLARLLERAGPVERGRCRSVVEARRPHLDINARVALTRLFCDPIWAAADLHALVPNGKPTGMAAHLLTGLMPYLESDADFELALAQQRLFTFPYAEQLLCSPPSRAVRRLVRLLQLEVKSQWPDHSAQRLVRYLACSSDPVAAAAIASVAGFAPEQAKAYFLAHPHYLAVLKQAPKPRGKRREIAAALVTELDCLVHGIAPPPPPVVSGDARVRQLDAELSLKSDKMLPRVRFEKLAELAAIGSPLAIVLLRKHALLSPYPDRIAHIESLLRALAERRGVPPDALEDDAFGDLQVAGQLPVLDFGPRRFRVVLSHFLETRFVDEAGHALAKLPKPNKKDDAAKAEQALAQLAALELDLADVRETVLVFFERAMASARVWEAERFQRTVARHPLLGQVARRLIFAAAGVNVRLAEDGTFADATDAHVAVAARAPVRVAHPLDLAPQELERFRQLFLDYELIQPFAQLERPVFRLQPHERDATELERFRSRMLIAAGRRKLIGAAGWQNGVGASMLKPLGARHVLFRFVEHGAKKRPAAVDEVTSVTLLEGPDPAPFGQLTDVEASELLRDLETLPLG